MIQVTYEDAALGNSFTWIRTKAKPPIGGGLDRDMGTRIVGEYNGPKQ